MAIITVFTPTYNRAYTLHKCYESLKRQTNKNFIWLVKEWIEENKISIKYIYQDNKGLHGAHNTAYENITTELNICIDSDDYMPEDSIEKIIEFWNKNKREDIAGIMGLDIYKDGKVIGDKFPDDLKESTYWDIYHKHKIKGDKKLVYRSDLTKKYPYPVFEGEKYVGLGYKYAKLDEEYKLLLMNEDLCVVEYMEDGSSKNMFRQYKMNPKGFSFIRIEDMKNPNATLAFKFKSCIHYVSSSLMSKNKGSIKETPCKLLTVAAIPMGFILYKHIMKNT